MGAIVEAPGAMQLSRPDETLEVWARRNPGVNAPVNDLMGGGYTLSLLGH